MRAALLLWLLCLPSVGWSQRPAPGPGVERQHQKPNSHDTTKKASADERGTTKSPLVVEVIPAPDHQQELEAAAREREEKAANDRKLVEFTGKLVTATWLIGLVGCLQLTVFGVQAWRLKQSMDETRAATTTVRDNAARQLRAYIVVQAGQFIPQNPAKGVLLHWSPAIINTGQTPAYHVRSLARVALLPFPPAADMDYSVQPDDRPVSEGTLGHGQSMGVPRRLDRLLTSAELRELEASRLAAKGKALYVYGRVTYRDIYNAPHHTNFCLYGFGQEKAGPAVGNMTEQHNDAS